MFKKALFAVIIVLGAILSTNVYAAQTSSEKITPNKLTIQRADGSGDKVTIDAFRIRGYNVAQLRSLIQACGGSIISTEDGYQIVTEPNNVPFTPIAFSGVTTVNIQINVTEIIDKSGNFIKPGEPGWVFLTDYNYNWGSIRDVLTAMGYEIKSFNDDPVNAQTNVIIGEIMKTEPKMQEFPTPTSFIGSNPIYIYYEDALKPCISNRFTVKYFNDTDFQGEKIWIYSRDGVSSIRIYRLDYLDDSDNFGFKVKQKLYESKLSSDEVLVLDTTVPEGIPHMAVTFIGNDGKTYSYVLGYNGRTGHVNAGLFDIDGI